MFFSTEWERTWKLLYTAPETSGEDNFVVRGRGRCYYESTITVICIETIKGPSTQFLHVP